jgi:hypothetical protein
MSAAQGEDMVPTVLGENANLLKLWLLNEKRELKLRFWIILKFDVHRMRNWEVLGQKFGALIICEFADPLDQSGLPSFW